MSNMLQVTTDKAAKLARVILNQKQPDGRVGRPVIFWGPPGIAKSDLARQIAGGLPLIDFRAGNFDRVDFMGVPSVERLAGQARGTTTWNSPGMFPIETRDGPEGVLLLDEVSNTPKPAQGPLLQLLLDGRLGEYIFPRGWKIIGTGNLQSHGASANVFSTASSNRVAHVELLPCSQVWTRDFAGPAGVHPAVVAFLQLRGKDLFHVMPEDPESHAYPTARTWTFLSEALYSAGADWQAMAYELACMWVGVAAAIEFRGYVAVWAHLPRLPQIETDPQGAPVPTELTAKFAVAGMLARAATVQNMDSVVVYLERLGAAFSEFGIQQATTRDSKLKETREYVARAIRLNQAA